MTARWSGWARGPAPGLPRGTAAALAVGGMLTWVLLRFAAPAFLPADVRILMALFALVLSPGFAVVALGARPPGGAWLAPMWALGLGVLINALLIGFAPGATLGGFEARWLATTLVLWVLALTNARVPSPAPALSGSPAALALVLAAAALASLHAGLLGTPINIASDSPDHIGTIRRIMATGHAFPIDAFFKDAGALGVDPRKGIWHPQVALVAHLAGVDPVTAWVRMSAMIAPLFVLNAAALGFVAAGPAGAAATAWALLLVWAGNSAWWPLRKAVFATFLNDQVALAACTALLHDLAVRRRASRVTAALLAAAAGAIHLFAAIQLGLATVAFVAGLGLRDRAASPAVRRASATAALMLLACAVLVLPRLVALPAPRNVIHTEPQGLLLLGGGWRIVSPGVVWDWMQQLAVLFPLAWIPLWRARRNDVALFVLTTSVGVALVVFNPVAVAWLEPRIGYLLMRMIWMAPLAALLGLAVVSLGRAVRGASGSPRALAAAALAGLVLLLLPTAREAVSSYTDAARIRADEWAAGPARWHAAMGWMHAHLRPDDVVLSDPATSYAIPMMSGQLVATLSDQHSSPTDSLALTRILDARDALDPYATWEHTRALIAKHGVTAVALNAQFNGTPRLDYWAPSPSWFASARARFDSQPRAFERLYDSGDFVVYRVHADALASLAGTWSARPCVMPYHAGVSPVGRRVGPGAPALVQLSLEPRLAAPGDTVRGIAQWRALEPLPAGSWQVPVRFDRALPGGVTPPAWIAKPVRKLMERVHGERYRFRDDHLPAAGEYGVDLWRPGEVVRDSFELVVPPDVADGVYHVEITMFRQPHYPNYRVRDFFLDEDYYAGVESGRLTVARRGAARMRHPAAPAPEPAPEGH